MTDTAYHGGLNLNAGSGQAGIMINGAVAANNGFQHSWRAIRSPVS